MKANRLRLAEWNKIKNYYFCLVNFFFSFLWLISFFIVIECWNEQKCQEAIAFGNLDGFNEIILITCRFLSGLIYSNGLWVFHTVHLLPPYSESIQITLSHHRKGLHPLLGFKGLGFRVEYYIQRLLYMLMNYMLSRSKCRSLLFMLLMRPASLLKYHHIISYPYIPYDTLW